MEAIRFLNLHQQQYRRLRAIKKKKKKLKPRSWQPQSSAVGTSASVPVSGKPSTPACHWSLAKVHRKFLPLPLPSTRLAAQHFTSKSNGH